MSDTVALALIAMVQSWGLAIIQNGPSILVGIGSMIVTVGGWWISRKVTAQGRQIAEQVESVKAVAIASAEETALIAKGAERRGFEGGIKTERLRASDLGRLQAGYKPESTDVFMRRTDDGPDTDG